MAINREEVSAGLTKSQLFEVCAVIRLFRFPKTARHPMTLFVEIVLKRLNCTHYDNSLIFSERISSNSRLSFMAPKNEVKGNPSSSF